MRLREPQGLEIGDRDDRGLVHAGEGKKETTKKREIDLDVVADSF